MSIDRAQPVRPASLPPAEARICKPSLMRSRPAHCHARIVVVVSNKREAPALDRARRHGITEVFLDPKPFSGRPDTREAYDRALLDVLRNMKLNLCCWPGT